MLRLLKILIETNLFIALAAVAFMWANIYLLDIHSSSFGILSLQVFCSTWFIYQISRWVYYKKGEYANKTELVLLWFEQYPALTKTMMYGSGILTLVFTCFLQWKTIVILCFLGAVSVLYPVPVLKFAGIDTRLRDFPFVKIFLIALVWSVTSVILPATEAGIHLGERRDVFIVLSAQFIYILFITLPFDINDAEVDKTTKTLTIPSVLGIKFSKLLGFFLGLMHALLILFIFMLENWRSIHDIYLTEGIVISIWVLLILLQLFTFYQSDKVPKWVIKVVYDGSMIIYFLILYINHLYCITNIR